MERIDNVWKQKRERSVCRTALFSRDTSLKKRNRTITAWRMHLQCPAAARVLGLSTSKHSRRESRLLPANRRQAAKPPGRDCWAQLEIQTTPPTEFEASQ